MIIKLPAAEAAQTIYMMSLGLLIKIYSVFTLNVIYIITRCGMIQISEPHAFNFALFLCSFCNRKSELPILYLRVSTLTIAPEVEQQLEPVLNLDGVWLPAQKQLNK